MEFTRDRKFDQIRNVKIEKNYLKHPDGSVLIEMGDTKVICTAVVEDKVPPFLKGTGKGWVTAEYAMLPASTATRKTRDISRLKLDGRSSEIQRLIGRALRSVVNLDGFGERTVWIDCDVIQADGGTRTASITGSFVALVLALNKLVEEGLIERIPVNSFVSAISVGIVNGETVLDLCYEEDSNAQVDMNVIMTDKNEYVEIQGTGEEAPFNAEQLTKLLALGSKGCKNLISIQKDILGKEICERIGEKSEEGEGKSE